MATKRAGAAAIGAGQTPERVEPTKPASATRKDAKRGRDKISQGGDERGRESRAQETHNELFERVDEDQPYIRPTSLEAPKPRPGYKQRWIRVGMASNEDTKNLTRKLREGWRARQSASVPKGVHVPRISSGKFAGTIMVEGMLLCEMPMKLAQKRAAAIAKETNAKTQAVNEGLMRVNQGSGGGFGPIKKGEKSEIVREVAQPGGEAELDLT